MLSQFGQGDIRRRVNQSQDFICMSFHPMGTIVSALPGRLDMVLPGTTD